MRYPAVFIACLLCAFVARSYGLTILKTGIIVFNGSALTSNGDGNQVTLSPINICDNRQLWNYDDQGFIWRQDNRTLVLDVTNSNPNNGVPTIMWIRKVPTSANQQWTVNNNGIASQLNGFYLRKSSASNGIVTSNNQPIQNFTFVTPSSTCPATCTSHGDPHFTTWTGQRYNFQSANTVLLADFSGTKIYTVQISCNPGVTCNEGLVVQPNGTTDSFQLTGINAAYYNKNRTAPLAIGTTAFGSYFNVTRTNQLLFTISIPTATVSYAAYRWAAGYIADVGITVTAPVAPAPSLCVGPSSGQDPHTYGSQFLVKNATDTAYQYAVTPFSYNPNYVPNYGPYTTNDTNLIAQTNNACSVFTTTYAACNAFIDPAFYQGTCYNDSIATGDISFTQQSIDTYAFLCSLAAGQNKTNITLPTSTVATIIVGAVTQLNTNVTTNFTIIAKDIRSVNRTTGGDNFTVTATGPANITFTVVDNNNGTYTVTYTTTLEGRYNISVKFNNISDISGSPFTINVTAVTSASTSSLVLGPTPVNTQGSFTIQARTASGAIRTVGGDSFTVSFSGGVFTYSIVDNNDGTYTVYYTAGQVGYYQVYVYYQSTSILCSPYTLIVR